MGHYFNYIELNEKTDMQIKIELLPKELIDYWYKKGWIYQNVKFDKHLKIVPFRYPIILHCYGEDLLESIEMFSHKFKHRVVYYDFLEYLKDDIYDLTDSHFFIIV